MLILILLYSYIFCCLLIYLYIYFSIIWFRYLITPPAFKDLKYLIILLLLVNYWLWNPFIIVLTECNVILSLITQFLALSALLMPITHHRNFIGYAWKSLLSFFIIIHVSLPYSKNTGIAIILQNFIWVYEEYFIRTTNQKHKICYRSLKNSKIN